MAIPIARADLVADQPVGGFGVGHAQQRLGQAHQRHALFGRERIFLGEGVHAAAPCALAADAAGEFAGQGLRRLGFGGGEFRLGDPFGRDGVLVREIGVG